MKRISNEGKARNVELRFTAHARARMIERRITEEDVRAALRARELVLPYQGGGERIIATRATSKPIGVGVKKFSDYIRVMTVFDWDPSQ